MSEPVTSNDIEDVVSSVKRLVSPETRPRPVSRDLEAERLILTPALRIVAEQSAAGTPTVRLEAAARKARPPDPGSMKARTLRSSVIGEDGAEILPPAGETAAAGPKDEPSLAEMALVADLADLVAAETPAEAAPPATGGVATPEEMAEAAPVKSGHSRRIRVGKGTVLRRDKPKAETDAPGTMVPEPAPEALADLPETPAPVEPFPELSPAAAAPAPEPTALTDVDGIPVSLLDEDQLILLLRRVIREELQGVLGERITRNVRKLVRAEIARALAADTLE